MTNKHYTTILLIIVVISIAWGLSRNYEEKIPPTNNVCKEDSLKNELTNLQIKLETEEDGWDFRERRYEQILFEYEYGINAIKETHPEAYREFHRIISYREEYNRKSEKENLKRLKSYGERNDDLR